MRAHLSRSLPLILGLFFPGCAPQKDAPGERPPRGDDTGEPADTAPPAEDCDGLDNDADQDGDGWSPCSAEPDCDDHEATVHPGAEELGGDGVDQDCDGLIDEGDWTAGDLVFTEVLAWPGVEPEGEWVELLNTSGRTVYLNSLTIFIKTINIELSITDAIRLAPGDRALLGQSADLALNGGVDLSGVLPGLILDNDGDQISIAVDGLVLDRVTWVSASMGASRALDPLFEDAALNDAPDHWCLGQQPWVAGGDLGSPGLENDLCPQIDHDGDGVPASGGDCDDLDPAISPRATEIWYDGVDQDCDGAGDLDADGDGFDAASVGGDDCDDGAPEVNPAATERCEPAATDDDCDGLIDEADDSLAGASEAAVDADGDGYGDDATWATICKLRSGFSLTGGDCDDADPAAHPGAEEIWYDGVDQDCDGASDLDADSDGYDASAGGGDDCDDRDAAISPGAAEICDPLDVDEDCDGLADDLDPSLSDAPAWHRDADGDGFGDPDAVIAACEAPSGYLADSSDCDDTDDTVHPGARETWYDGEDRDCAGDSDYDADGDGDDSVVYGGVDCNDSDPDDGPDGVERVGDGLDNDCDGVADPLEVLLKITGHRAYSSLGLAVSAAGDVNGDGQADVLVGAGYYDEPKSQAGAAFLFTALDEGSLSSDAATAILTGAELGDYVGTSLCSPGDLDGDGYSELLIGAPGDNIAIHGGGAAYLVDGPVTGTEQARIAGRMLAGVYVQDHAGYGVSGAGDLNDDGYLDLVIGAPHTDAVARNAGTAYLLFGPVSTGHSLALADASWAGLSANDYAAQDVRGGGDVDGDGLPDLLVGATYSDLGATNAGAVWLLLGPASASGSLTDADATVYSVSASARLGGALASLEDSDGDGYADLLLGAKETDNMGAAWLMLGPVSGAVSVERADLTVLAVTVDSNLGSGVDLGDVNGDGRADLLIGAFGEYSAELYSGALLVLLGGQTGTYTPDQADLLYYGEASREYLGRSVARAGDVDGDGIDDVLVGADSDDEGGSDAGAATLLVGGAW